ncbi:hypothetical protein B0J13DRAFT_615834 [Dactylonectria estremocensis]|uniref:Uncharacterized protein n=1 Tax=Dactylonectria estremocensis TaxID=1079267 RepID=A0A9P9FKQ6_9HYPO|nr:hypothetical protein B0J13DRAFT_615834 [Dactylonectria estremocensis]
MASHIPSPSPGELLAPFLPSLPAASMSTQPATGILPLLSPILRQRVNFLSSSSTEPWLRLLCYDTAKAAKLAEIAQGGSLEPHPVSGEVEVDWDYDAEIRFRRVDQETLQALVVLDSLGLAFQLLYCVGDKEGGGDGWRVGEVTVADKPSPFSQFGGVSTVAEAERQFEESRLKIAPQANGTSNQTLHVPGEDHGNDDDDDDDYWARYDATPARTPAQKQSPAPASMSTSQVGGHLSASTEDDYYAQYDDVQPAMDPHDPDEAAEQAQFAPPLGLSQGVRTHESAEANELNETQGAWTLAELEKTESNPNSGGDDADKLSSLVHPRPSSSASSNGSRTVAKLEATADMQEQNEFGVKQHVSRSIRSLYFLARSSGINREEFERLIHTELDILGMVEDHD